MVSFFKKKFSDPDSATKTALSGVFKLVNLMLGVSCTLEGLVYFVSVYFWQFVKSFRRIDIQSRVPI